MSNAIEVYRYSEKEKNTYYFNVPYAELKEKGTLRYDMVLTSHYTKDASTEIVRKHTTKVTIMQMPLFTLN